MTKPLSAENIKEALLSFHSMSTVEVAMLERELEQKQPNLAGLISAYNKQLPQVSKTLENFTLTSYLAAREASQGEMKKITKADLEFILSRKVSMLEFISDQSDLNLISKIEGKDHLLEFAFRELTEAGWKRGCKDEAMTVLAVNLLSEAIYTSIK